MSARDAAKTYLARGWAPIPVPHGQKRPALSGWPELRITEATIDEHFNGELTNLGVLTGEPSGGLTDVDLDAAEAVVLADQFLSPTGSVFGRPGKPRSHRLYVCSPIVPTTQLEDTDGVMIAELRSTGAQTLFPPSVADGETRRWERDGEPTRIDGPELLGRVKPLASAALLRRHWPEPGSRHRASLALVGGLLRAGWSKDDASDFLLAVALAAGDEEARDRPENVRTTARRLAADRQATGWPTLAGLLRDGQKVVDKLRDWLRLRDAEPEIVFERSGRAAGGRERAAPWPDPLAVEAYYGLVGDLVRAIEPHSEAARPRSWRTS
jgi:hypothetical protein